MGRLPVASAVINPFDLADPERRLALAYARSDAREDLLSLFLLDERLGAIVAATKDAMLGEIRLTWWRDALRGLADKAPPDEPLLQRLFSVVQKGACSADRLAAIAEGWGMLLSDPPVDEDMLIRYGEKRGSALFRAVADILGCPQADVGAAGSIWALTDLAFRSNDDEISTRALALARKQLSAAKRGHWPASLRPLAIMMALARLDLKSSSRKRSQGAPQRIVRAIWAGLTGR